MSEALDRLTRLRGLGEAYYDYRGSLHHFSEASRRAILQAMRIPIDSDEAMAAALEQPLGDTASHPVINQLSCYQPDALNSKRCWGFSIQLYGLRSANNWGIGDFADLRQLIRFAAPFGCDVIGLNPLHAAFPAAPEHFSPYSPSSRLFLNALYIAVHELDEFKTNNAIVDWFSAAPKQSELQSLRANPQVQYERVAKLKFAALKKTFAIWKTSPQTHQEFSAFVAEQGEALYLHALFDVLDQHFRKLKPAVCGWPQWPEEFRDPHSQASKDFAATHTKDIKFFQYLQWLAAKQLQQAQLEAKALGMSIGLYGDLAVGAACDGSEIWSNQSLYVTGASAGAPPDPMGLNGQDWGIPPMDPFAIKAQEFRPIRNLFRANMRYVGALRIDHVMSLFRLWWVPRGLISTHGVYVHYPLDAMCSVLAVESQHNQCMVIGEDLGVVPDEIRKAMSERHLLHYKVLLFEKEGSRFKTQQEYIHDAIATASTHDMPPLKAWWQGNDLDLRERLGLYASPELVKQLRDERQADRRGLLTVLNVADEWQWQSDQAIPEFTAKLAQAIHRYLAKTPSALVLLQLEDLIGMIDPVNVPGTYLEHANWQRKLTLSIEEIFALSTVQESLQAVQKARSN